MPRLTNPTNGTKGAWVAAPGALFGGQTLWIEPNKYVDVPSINEAERASFEAIGGVVTDDPLDHDGDGEKGGSVPRRGRPPKARD